MLGPEPFCFTIVEYAGNHNVQVPGTPMTTKIGGRDMTHSETTGASGALAYFLRQDQGSTFQLTAQIAGPLTEQDVEQMIASMLGQGR